MTEITEIISNSEEETTQVGITIAKSLTGDELIPIIGELGVGKTVLVRGIARGMGYDGRVRSPSYTIERVYDTPSGELHHWDLYRLSGTSEVEPLFDQIRMQKGVRVVEWGERLDEFLSGSVEIIEMHYTESIEKRIIRICRTQK